MVTCIEQSEEMTSDDWEKLKARLIREAEEEWSEDWPTEPGDYWFHGWRGGMRISPPCTYLAKVRWEAGGTLVYYTGSLFLSRENGTYGKWLPAELPEPPVLEDTGGGP